MSDLNREYEYAKDLAVHLWESFYKDDAPDWQPLPDLCGVLSQIDNMTTGLRREDEISTADSFRNSKA